MWVCGCLSECVVESLSDATYNTSSNITAKHNESYVFARDNAPKAKEAGVLKEAWAVC